MGSEKVLAKWGNLRRFWTAAMYATKITDTAFTTDTVNYAYRKAVVSFIDRSEPF